MMILFLKKLVLKRKILYIFLITSTHGSYLKFSRLTFTELIKFKFNINFILFYLYIFQIIN